jgi:hypothetical protein
MSVNALEKEQEITLHLVLKYSHNKSMYKSTERVRR